jgi:hypothetical protein
VYFLRAVREAQRAGLGEQHGQGEVVGEAARAVDLDRMLDDPLCRGRYRDLDLGDFRRRLPSAEGVDQPGDSEAAGFSAAISSAVR